MTPQDCSDKETPKKQPIIDNINYLIETYKRIRDDVKIVEMLPGIDEQQISEIKSTMKKDDYKTFTDGAICGLRVLKTLLKISNKRLPSPFEKLRRELNVKK